MTKLSRKQPPAIAHPRKELPKTTEKAINTDLYHQFPPGNGVFNEIKLVVFLIYIEKFLAKIHQNIFKNISGKFSRGDRVGLVGKFCEFFLLDALEIAHKINTNQKNGNIFSVK